MGLHCEGGKTSLRKRSQFQPIQLYCLGAIKVEDNCAHGFGVQQRDKGQAVDEEFTGLLAGEATGPRQSRVIRGVRREPRKGPWGKDSEQRGNWKS